MINKRQFLLILAIIVIIIFGVLLTGEVSIRLYLMLSGKGGYICLPDDYLGVIHAPNSKFTYKEKFSNEFSIKRNTNSLGLIGGQISIKKPENVFRILILGDSFSEGLHVEEGRNFCEQLQYFLNKNSSLTDKHFEIINAGISGYSPISEYLFFKRELARLKPDIVILQIFANDVFEDNKTRAMSILDKDGLPIKINRFFIKKYWNNPIGTRQPTQLQTSIYRLKKIIIGKSMLFQCLARAKRKSCKRTHFHKEMTDLPEFNDGNQFFIIQDYNPLFQNSGFRNKTWNNTKRYILAIRDLAKENKAAFFIFYIPPKGQLKLQHYGENSAYFPKPANYFLNERLKELSEEKNIYYLDLLFLFEKNGDKDLYYEKDGHLKTTGHSLVAEALFDFLNKHKLFQNGTTGIL